MAGMGLLDSTREIQTIEEEDSCCDSSDESSDYTNKNYVVTGQLNRGQRIDYVSNT